MKDQYVADVNDYFKYAVLRAWQRAGLRLALGWMLTAADGRSDGAHIGYLAHPERFRGFDSGLFDGLAQLVEADARTVRAVAARQLPEAMSFETRLTDEILQRRQWWQCFQQSSRGRDVLFLDPDNGLEVASVPNGARGSHRYVFTDELAALQRPGQSVAVYQHFPRVERRGYVTRQLLRLNRAWPSELSFALCSTRIALLVSAAAPHRETLLREAGTLVARAPAEMKLWLHVATSHNRPGAPAGR